MLIENPEIIVRRGKQVPRQANIAVVVMSIDSNDFTRQAVESLLQQDENPEVVVVNTGRGSLQENLSLLLDRIVLVESPIRRLPGGTRNLGIKYSNAPIVAFLAADCLATPGWLSRRIAMHRDGSTVASALLPAPSHEGRVLTTSWASCLLTHFSRLPQTPPAEAVRFGLSYRREIFSDFGLFDENVRIGEDTLINQQLERSAAPTWDPEIVTLHRYPEKFFGALADQFRRGQHLAAFRSRFSPCSPIILAAANIKRGIKIVHFSIMKRPPDLPPEAINAAWLVPILALAASIGMLLSGRGHTASS